MNKSREELLELLKDDPFNLIGSQSKSYSNKGGDILVNAFEEIVNFFEDYGRVPSADANNNSLMEFQLASRLNAIRKDIMFAPEKRHSRVLIF